MTILHLLAAEVVLESVSARMFKERTESVLSRQTVVVKLAPELAAKLVSRVSKRAELSGSRWLVDLDWSLLGVCMLCPVASWLRSLLLDSHAVGVEAVLGHVAIERKLQTLCKVRFKEAVFLQDVLGRVLAAVGVAEAVVVAGENFVLVQDLRGVELADLLGQERRHVLVVDLLRFLLPQILVLVKLVLASAAEALLEPARGLESSQFVVQERIVVGIGVVVELVNDVFVQIDLVLLMLELPLFLFLAFGTVEFHGDEAVAARLVRVAFPLNVVLHRQLSQRTLAHFQLLYVVEVGEEVVALLEELVFAGGQAILVFAVKKLHHVGKIERRIEGDPG